MAEETVRDLAEFELPFGRHARLREVRHESGLRLVRLVLREGRRITQVDLDEASARDLGTALADAAGTEAAPEVVAPLLASVLARLEPDHDRPATGEVYLVGAGPGDPDLLTCRALRLMQRADVVLYDRLIGTDIMALVRPGAERIYVGKCAKDHTMPQADITRLMISLAKDGKQVLRLKGGDPFIFGRGGEEIEALADEGIPFQVVPGITAASGCATYAGIPLTHRDHAQACTFVTAHGREGVLDLDWDVLIRPGQTVAVYMGLSSLTHLVDGFASRGVDLSVPVAVVSHGTRPNQTVVTAPLGKIVSKVQTSSLTSPAMIIIGTVVTLRDRLAPSVRTWPEP